MDLILDGRLKAYMEHETGQSSLVMELASPKDEVLYSYQVEMLAQNPKEAIIPIEIRRKDDSLKLYYNVTSKVALEDFLKYRKLTVGKLVEMLLSFVQTLQDSRSLLLIERNFLLSKEFVFIEPESRKICMVYLPINADSGVPEPFKDFLLKLVESTVAVQSPEELYDLKRIFEYAKSTDFNLTELLNLLNSIKNKSILYSSTPATGMAGTPQTETKQERSMSEQTPKALKNTSDTKLKEAPGAHIPGFNLKGLLIILVSQLVLAFLALSAEFLMRSLNAASDTRYISIGLFVFVSDLLVFKHVVMKKSITGGGPDKKSRDKNGTDVINTVLKKKQNHNTSVKNNFDLMNHEQNILSAHENKKDTPELLTIQDFNKSNNSNTLGANYSDETTLLNSNDTGLFLTREKEGVVECFEINKEYSIIGRDPNMCDIIIKEKAVGRKHAEIAQRNDGYYIKDKSSKNGTYLNNSKLEAGIEYKLNNNDSIIFANVEYKTVLKNCISINGKLLEY